MLHTREKKNIGRAAYMAPRHVTSPGQMPLHAMSKMRKRLISTLAMLSKMFVPSGAKPTPKAFALDAHLRFGEQCVP